MEMIRTDGEAGIDAALLSIVQKAQTHKSVSPNDYISHDGLLYCGTCHEPKEYLLDLGKVKKKVYCMCACDRATYQKEMEEKKIRERRVFIESLRIQGIQDRSLQRCTFSNAKRSNNIERCKSYVDKWGICLQRNIGILMYGPPGTGKTFAAACIANALVERCVPVLMTSFPKILNSGYNKSEITDSMKNFQLLVIDDLGVERDTTYALEVVQFIVDERYKSQLPTIITTNLSKDEMNKPQRMEFHRIYSRVMEMCTPMAFVGESWREVKRKGKTEIVKEIFN